MRILQTLVMACALVAGFAGQALAADGGHLDWGNFFLRVLTLAVVLYIIYHFAGAKIAGFFVGHREAVQKEMDDAARMKREAEAHLADIEKRVANVEAECAALLEQGKSQAEALKSTIIEDAEKQAAAIVEQARRAAEQEGKAELDAIRSILADDIMEMVEKGLVQRLDAAGQEQLIEKSLGKVVIQ